MKEVLSDGCNGVNDDGDVVPFDQVEWQPKEPFVPDHLFDDKGPSVRLTDRAIAIEAIMGYFNQVSKNNGRRQPHGSEEFNGRYHHGANEVAKRMNAKEKRLHGEFMKSVNALMARDGMIEAGFSPQEVDAGERQLIWDLYHEYGPGRADAAKRKKLTRKVNRTVRIVVDGKKR